MLVALKCTLLTEPGLCSMVRLVGAKKNLAHTFTVEDFTRLYWALRNLFRRLRRGQSIHSYIRWRAKRSQYSSRCESLWSGWNNRNKYLILTEDATFSITLSNPMFALKIVIFSEKHGICYRYNKMQASDEIVSELEELRILLLPVY